MKRISTYTLLAIAAIFALLAIPLPASAQAIKEGYVQANAATKATTNDLVFPASSSASIRLVALNAVGNTTNNLTLYSGTNALRVLTCTTNGSSVTNITIASTNGITAGTVLVIQDATDNAFVSIVQACPSSSNLTLVAQSTSTRVPNIGDTVFVMGHISYIQNSGINYDQAGPCLFQGYRRNPILIRTTGSAASCAIANAVVLYDPVW